MTSIRVRPARPSDREVWVRLRQALWPDGSATEHEADVDRFFAGASTNPLAVFVAESANADVVGFAEVSIRSYAEDCVTDRVGFLEGWFVAPELRQQGAGRALVTAAEAWARARGCTEFASDAEADNRLGAIAHRALGFSEAGMVRCFRKDL